MVTQKKLSKESAGIATGWPLLNKIVILMLRMCVWVLCECYIWAKNHVQWMSRIKTLNNDNNNNDNNNNKLSVSHGFVMHSHSQRLFVGSINKFRA